MIEDFYNARKYTRELNHRGLLYLAQEYSADDDYNIIYSHGFLSVTLNQGRGGNIFFLFRPRRVFGKNKNKKA